MGGGSYPKAAPSFGDFDQQEYGFEEEEYQENDDEPECLEEIPENYQLQ